MVLLQIAEPGQTPQPHQRRLAVGIDLGTTNSLVAAVRSGVAAPLADAEGRLILPSAVRYLADRYGYGTLAPKIDEADRGAYLKWMVYSSAVVDPVATLHEQKIDLPGYHFSFGAFDDMVQVLCGVLKDREYLLGERFSAADVVLGGTLSRLLYQKVLPETPVLLDYNGRLTAREAYHRAADATWPSHLFPTPA